MRGLKFYISGFLILYPLLFFAQSVKVIGDLRSRSSFGVEKEIGKKLTLNGDFEIGLEENISKLGKLHGEFQVGYFVLKNVDFQIAYRFTKNRKNYSEEYKYTHMLSAASSYSHKIDRFKLYHRIKYQNVDEDEMFTGEAASRNIVKYRFKTKYNIRKSKLSPYISSELYTAFGVSGFDFSKLKSIIGFEVDMDEFGEVKLYYRNDYELTNYIPYNFHTLGMAYVYKF